MDKEGKIDEFGRKLVDCRFCGTPTGMTGSRKCDECWESLKCLGYINRTTKLKEHILNEIGGVDKEDIQDCANKLCSFSHGIDGEKDLEMIKEVEQKLRNLTKKDVSNGYAKNV